ncbi:nucleotide-sugar transporter-domain-containing protein [Polychytrium aggregatum]|uniref:nucleotide-sugar transporter-domain-containing protein n=1 Tax=Polychytrium aggregatum TaxID=110093 RepID=UPI0022FE5A21|nr:nucleotide-sugar transporter-domain-containing protein [Polychytrium aggregatum]KAI9206926.1 nucleotide-sugar transporter-domain-containing protein [Polychytrium aggregatum]
MAILVTHLKWISLLVLVVQNSALVLIMRYSRTIPGPPYLASTAVVLSELTKLVVSLMIQVNDEIKQNPGGTFSWGKVYSDILGPTSDWKKIMVPAVLYMIQNNLQYLAVTCLDAATFQVTYQMKILTTALFSVWLLSKPLSKMKWISLLILTIGIALVQLPSTKTDAKKSSEGEAASNENLVRFVGLVAVTVACILSGLAGVWFEKVLKGSKASVWVRNVQLSLFSIIPGFFIGVCYMDYKVVVEHGFFYGYNIWTFAAIACQALGGLIVALVVKYADNILKGFATSISIILSSVMSIFLFSFVVTGNFFIGASLVILSTYLYSLKDPAPTLLPVSTSSVSHEK